MNLDPTKANAGIAGRRSVLTRTVFYREGSRLHGSHSRGHVPLVQVAGPCSLV